METTPRTLPVAEVLTAEEAAPPPKRRGRPRSTTPKQNVVVTTVDKARQAVSDAAGGLKMACWFIDKAGGPDVAERLLKAAIAAINHQLNRPDSGLIPINPYGLKPGQEFMNASGEVFKIVRHEIVDDLPVIFVENPAGDEQSMPYTASVYAVPKE